MMNKMTLIFLILSFSASGQERITLEDAKSYALKHNFSIKSLRQKLEASQSQISVFKSDYFPDLGVAAGGEGQSSSYGVARKKSATVAYAYGRYNLFNGLRDQAQIDISKKNASFVESELKEREFILGLEVEENFYQYLYLKNKLKIYEKILATGLDQQKMVQRKMSVGQASLADLMEFKLQSSLLSSDIQSIKQELHAAKLAMVRILGLEIGYELEPVGDLPHYHVIETLPELLNSLKESSQDVVRGAIDVSISQLEAKKAKSGWLPSIDVEVKGGYLPLGERPASGGSSVSGIVLANWEFFSGLKTVAANNVSIAQMYAKDHELKNRILTHMTSVENIYTKLKSIEQRVDTEESNLESAEKYYKTVISEYQRGIKNSPDVKSALELFKEVQLRKENFKYEFILAKINLEKEINKKTSVEVNHEKSR